MGNEDETPKHHYTKRRRPDTDGSKNDDMKSPKGKAAKYENKEEREEREKREEEKRKKEEEEKKKERKLKKKEKRKKKENKKEIKIKKKLKYWKKWGYFQPKTMETKKMMKKTTLI